MTNKLFDSFISNKLNNYESPVPDGLWEKIMGEEERKPKAIWWWNKGMLMLGLGIAFLLSGLGYYAINNTNKTQKNNAAIATNSKQEINVKSNDLSNAINENSIKENVNSIEENKAESDIKNLNVKAGILENKTVKSEKNLTKNSNKSVALDKKILFKMKQAKLIENVVVSANSKETNKNNFLIKKDNTKTRNQNKNLFNNGTNTTLINNSSNFNGNLFVSSKTTVWGNTLFEEKNLYNINNLNDAKILAIGKLFSGTDDCPTTRGVYRNDFYVEGYVSTDYAYKTVTSTKSGNDSYLQKKDSSETMRLGFTIGARFSKSITNNLLLKAGLQYSQFNERLTLRTENDRRQTIVINSHTITRPGQSDTTISDTSVFVQIGYRIRTNTNRYKNLEVPIILSYELSQPESKWKLAINGGAIVNLTSWYEGKTLDAGYNLVNVGNKSNNGIYKNQVGVSLYGGLTIMRNINQKLDVFAEPYFRYGLSNSLQSSAGFNQKFNVIGLQLGARLKLSKFKHL